MSRSLFFNICILGVFFSAVYGAPWASLFNNDFKSVITCRICNQFVDAVLEGFSNNASNEAIAGRIADICETAGIYDYKTCYGVTFIALPTIRYIYNTPEFIEGNVCAILAQTQNCSLSDPLAIEWAIGPSSRPKPPVTQPNVTPQGPTIKVLHLADIHWDPEYLVGSLANCEDSLCCRLESGPVTELDSVAGYWGDYHDCDPPLWTIENAMSSIAREHPDIGHIIWTGDLVPHDVYDTSKEENIMIMDTLFNLTQKYFRNIPVYATLGNHESHPVNTFSPPEITDAEVSTSWVYQVADTQWSRWLPADVSSTIRSGGYYTTLARPGLRIVSMNMNYCYTFNWWTLYKSQDPASNLIWLRGVLEAAEAAGEKVHILSHIPPGSGDCWQIWSREFNKIINRFESTVAAQFYGHTHDEEYKIFYDAVEKTRPTNVAFIGGSLSPGGRKNPGYRIYTVDGERQGSSFTVLDFSTWIMNLKEANLYNSTREPIWYELYKAKTEYGLSDLSPASMDGLFNRMLTDQRLFNSYYRNYHKANEEKTQQGCDDDCRKKLLCSIVTTVWDDQSRCLPILK